MPRYYFDLYLESSLITDQLGMELEDPRTLRWEAAVRLRKEIAQLSYIDPNRSVAIGVRDEEGRIIAQGTLKLEIWTP